MNTFADARADVCIHARKMWQAGLVVGSAGNVSRRADASHIAVTPTSLAYDAMTDEDVVLVETESGKTVDSIREPTYELPMHLSIYRAHPEVQAIVHTHAPFVTALSVLRRPLPPLLDEMVVHLGGQIEVADYAFTGTDQVGTAVLRVLSDHNGVLLANHGNVCVGRSLSHALHAAIVMEAGAQLYVQCLAVGTPVLLPDESVVAGRRLFEARNKLS
jgi:L-fuculose-phosphate aldolase